MGASTTWRPWCPNTDSGFSHTVGTASVCLYVSFMYPIFLSSHPVLQGREKPYKSNSQKGLLVNNFCQSLDERHGTFWKVASKKKKLMAGVNCNKSSCDSPGHRLGKRRSFATLTPLYLMGQRGIPALRVADCQVGWEEDRDRVEETRLCCETIAVALPLWFPHR